MIIWELITWLVFGFIVGFLANLIDPHTNEGGVFGYIVLGIIGSIVGGYLAGLLGIQTEDANTFSFSSVLTAIVGSLIVLFIYRLIRNNSNKINR
jgi:uncharacterized membrane protein YeaQ/YmgE (transglycosylase-associated protein family)